MFYKHLSILLLILLFLIATSSKFASAQNLSDANASSFFKGWAVTPSILYGKIWKHTEKFEPSIDEHSRCLEIAIESHTHGKREWEYSNHYPFLGIATSFNILGNDSILGNAFAVFPFIEIPVVPGKKFFGTIRVATGLAYLTKHYDEVENPTNNVIASHFNNTTQFALSFNWKPTDHLTFLFGTSFTHYSSGAVRLPNLGINIPAWRLGVRLTPNPFTSNEYLQHTLSKPPKKIFFNAQLSLGFQELSPHNGPMYQVYEIEFSAGKMLSRSDLFSIGMLANYKESSSAFIKQQEIYNDQIFLKSTAAAGFFRNDLIFGNIGLPILIGYYFYSPSPIQLKSFQKLGSYYSFPLSKEVNPKKISIGVYVTAGDFTADFVSVECGFRF